MSVRQRVWMSRPALRDTVGRMPQKTALLIDANALIHRAWHALPPLTSSDGKLVNAVYGFALVLQKILGSEKPDYLVICWDTAAPTFRHVAAPEYKAQREEQPQEFYDQIPLVKELVTAYGGTNVALDGFEADDLLGTFATSLATDTVNVSILTSDRDAWQLIGPHVKVIAFKKGVSETVTYDESLLKETTGLRPDQIVDYKAMRGDASDNLKGIPGIGEKTATELLLKFDDLKGIFKAAKNAKSDLTPSVRQKLIDGEKTAEKMLPLVRIVTDVPVHLKTSELVTRPADQEAIKELFTRLGFKTLLARAIGGASRKNAVMDNAHEPIHATTPPASTIARMPKPKKTVGAVNAVTHAQIASAKDLKELFDAAYAEGELIIHPLETEQASLFADLPELALGTRMTSAVLTRSIMEQKDVAPLLRAALADASLKKTGHAMKDAWHWCHEKMLELEGVAFDTEIASYILSAGEGGHDLETLAAAELGVVFSDGEQRPFQKVDAIRMLRQKLSEELTAQRLTHILDRFELPLIPVLGRMEEFGILIDRPYFKHLSEDFRLVKQRLEKEMMKLAGEEFNPASPGQLADILFDTLKLSTKGIKKGKTGFSTAASELEKLEGAHPIIEKVGEFREVTKLLSTYVDTLPEQADAEGRVHTTFNQTVAATGRLSSTDPNLQNIPIRTELGRKIRRGFISQPGHVLLSCDYSQIELRVIAALAKDAKMLEAFEKGLDIHTATAAAIWHVPLDEVTKDQRRAVKAINFGIIYGQGPQGLSKAAGVPFEEAKEFIAEYFHVYSGIREYLDQTKALAHARGYVETLFGRRRPIPEINSPLPQMRAAAERMAINMPVQGTATGDLVKLALIEIAKRLPEISPKTRLLLQVHDEVVLEVPEKEVTKVAAAVRDIMENIEKIGVPLVVDAKFGKNWEEMEKVG